MTAMVSQALPECSAILFDFAGTLFDDRSLRQPMLENLRWLADEIGLSLDDAALRAAYKQGMRKAFFRYADKISYLHDDFFGDCYRLAFYEAIEAADDALIAEAMRRQNDNTARLMKLRPGCLETLAALRASGFHVQVVSNFDELPLQAALRSSGVMPHIDAWTSSEAAASCKPHTGIFKAGLKKAGCGPEAAVYVGDSPVHDMAGARAVGMRSILIDPDHRHTEIDDPEWLPDYRIEALGELCSIKRMDD